MVKKRADKRLHPGVDETFGQRKNGTVIVTDGKGFCRAFVTDGACGICTLNVTEGQREKG